MKRVGNLYAQIYAISNLLLADKKASKGKSKQKGVVEHRRSVGRNIIDLHLNLKNKIYKTSQYSVFQLYEPKQRDIYRLPYYPDRICHHAIMNILEPVLVPTLISNTYSCLKKRGIHRASIDVKKAFLNVEETQYCLKLDIKKFFQNIDHDILKTLLRRKIKDKDLLWLLDEIIDSTSGLPIGNYISSSLANFYLTYFDHWIKETKRIKYYFRYCDDLVILHSDKNYLHQLRQEIQTYVSVNLKLEIKSNYQVFPIQARGLDFVGYKHYHTHTLLRKSIKKNFIAKKNYSKSLTAYYGWLKHCNGVNLWNKHTA